MSVISLSDLLREGNKKIKSSFKNSGGIKSIIPAVLFCHFYTIGAFDTKWNDSCLLIRQERVKAVMKVERLSSFECGEIQIDYFRHGDQLEWIIVPKSMHDKVNLPKKIKFDSLIQVKLVGAAYPKGFSTGHSMRNSQTVKEMTFINQKTKQCGDRLEIHTLFSDKQNNEYAHVVVWDGAIPVIETYVTVTNHSNRKQGLELLSSFSLSNLSPFQKKNLPKSLSVTRYRSKWSMEGRKETAFIEAFQLEPSWKPSGAGIVRYGQIGSMPVRGWFPRVSVTDHLNNVTWAVCLAHPASWQIEVYRLDEDLCLSGGLADRDYGHWLKELAVGESFSTPPAYLTAAIGAEEGATQQLNEFLKRKREDEKKTKTEARLAVQYNDFCTTWGKPSEQSIVETLQVLKGRAVDYFIIDAGWYAQPDKSWEKGHGDWEINPQQFPNGIDVVLTEIKEAGFVPGIWFEIETVGSDSAAFSLVDHLLKRDGRPLTIGDRRFWDMCDPWVRNYLRSKVIGFLKTHKIGYLKIDYNENFGIGCDGKESLGEANRQQIEATQLFIREIRETLPDLVIENCSSGGHRLEPSMMGLTDLSSFSDAHEAACIPLIAANLQQLILPEQSLIWAVIREEDMFSRIYYSMAAVFLGRICLSGDLHKLNEKQWKIIDEALTFYEEIKEIIKRGKSTICRENVFSYREPTGYQAVVRSNKDESLVVVHCFDQKQCEFIVPKNTEVKLMYGVKEQGISYKLSEGKMTLSFSEEQSACAFIIKRVKK